MSVKPDIKEELTNYLKLKLDAGIEKATVVSAYKLSSDETAKIKASYPEIRNLSVKNEVNQGIISGFIIKYGSYVVDLSLRGKLNSFKKLFYEIT